jgi:hypothetical protein
MLLHRSTIKTDSVSYLLIANTYIAFILSSPIFIDMCIHSIYGHLHTDSSFDGWGCQLKSYALYITGCVYFYSFLFQSIYRFCRIVHPARVIFQSFYPYLTISLIQWILAALVLLPSLLLGDFKYSPEDYHCQLVPTDLRGSLIGLSIVFVIPLTSTLICYFYTLYYVLIQTTALTTINRYSSIRRDLIILSRLVFLFIFVTAVALPHVLIPIIYAITGYLPSWVVSLEWLLTLFSLAAANIIQVFVFPHLRKLILRPIDV